MRSSTRKADRVRAPLLVLALTMAACTAVFPAEDHSLDKIEAQKDRAFAP